jgi:hypothetical protein
MLKNINFNNNELSNKLNDYFRDNIKFSLKIQNIYKLLIISKKDVFYKINIYNENIHLFDSSNDLIIEKMIVQELNYKEIIELIYGYTHLKADQK